MDLPHRSRPSDDSMLVDDAISFLCDAELICKSISSVAVRDPRKIWPNWKRLAIHS